MPLQAKPGLKQLLKVILAFDGDKTGSLRNVRLLQSSGYAELDEAAVACVKTWHFDPQSPLGKLELGPRRIAIDWIFTEDSTQNVIGRRGGIPHTCPHIPEGVPPGTTGTTRVRFFITTDGHVRDTHVITSSGNTLLDEEAVRCTVYWRYRPAVKDGSPIEVPWEANLVWKIPAEEQNPSP
jgi:TonB family protein